MRKVKTVVTTMMYKKYRGAACLSGMPIKVAAVELLPNTLHSFLLPQSRHRVVSVYGNPYMVWDDVLSDSMVVFDGGKMGLWVIGPWLCLPATVVVAGPGRGFARALARSVPGPRAVNCGQSRAACRGVNCSALVVVRTCALSSLPCCDVLSIDRKWQRSICSVIFFL